MFAINYSAMSFKHIRGWRTWRVADGPREANVAFRYPAIDARHAFVAFRYPATGAWHPCVTLRYPATSARQGLVEGRNDAIDAQQAFVVFRNHATAPREADMAFRSLAPPYFSINMRCPRHPHQTDSFRLPEGRSAYRNADMQKRDTPRAGAVSLLTLAFSINR